MFEGFAVGRERTEIGKLENEVRRGSTQGLKGVSIFGGGDLRYFAAGQIDSGMIGREDTRPLSVMI